MTDTASAAGTPMTGEPFAGTPLTDQSAHKDTGAGTPGPSMDSSAMTPNSPDAYPGGLAGCLEAILISAEGPLPAAQIAAVLHCDETAVAQGLEDLAASYSRRGSGIAILSSARGWRIGSSHPYDPVVSAFLSDRHAAGSLSHAALEALAIIAYQQPVTRADVTRIRGVASDSSVRSLVLHGLVTEQGTADGSSARMLVTTDLFLERLGITDLSDLPPLAPFLPDQQEALSEADQAAREETHGPDLRGLSRTDDPGDE